MPKKMIMGGITYYLGTFSSMITHPFPWRRLEELKISGMDSMPRTAAEMLVDTAPTNLPRKT
jgi:2-iminoacetate synthase ThiH